MFEVETGYKTGSGNLLGLTIFGELLDRYRVPVFAPELLVELCGDCRGVNGGCPGMGAPYLDWLRPTLTHLYVMVVQFDMAWAIEYAGHSNYFRSGYADRLTDHYTWRMIKRLEELTGGYGIGCGNCPRCSPKKCTVGPTGKCAYPRERRYSMEALGIDCSRLHQQLFGEILSWWYYTPELPQYMYRYAGLLMNSTDCDDALLQTMKLDNSYTDEVEVPVDYPTVILGIPPDCEYEGEEYIAYAPVP